MKYIAATVLTLSLLATGSALAGPNNDRGPAHRMDDRQAHAAPARPAAQAKPPVAAAPSQHRAPPRVVHAPPKAAHGPRHAPRYAPAPPPRHVAYTPRRGDRLPPTMRGYRINDWRHAGLRQPPRDHEWRRVDGRDLLVAVATGVITDIIFRSY